MWGPPTSRQWAAHDPYLLADKLKGVSLYISSGSGTTGPYDQPSGIPGVSTNYAGMGLEILSRLTSQTFATKLNKLGIPAQVNYRPSGTHSWPYWQFELHQLWPQLANAVGVERRQAGVQRTAVPSPGSAARTRGSATASPPSTASRAALARTSATAGSFTKSDTGAQPVAGAIGGVYRHRRVRGPARLPDDARTRPPPTVADASTTSRTAPSTGRRRPGRTPSAARSSTSGHDRAGRAARSDTRWPSEDPTPGKAGAVQGFEIGAMYISPANGTHARAGNDHGQVRRTRLGKRVARIPEVQRGRDQGQRPVQPSSRAATSTGAPLTGAWAVENGPIFDAWKSAGYEGGRLGFPISDKFDIPGGVQQNFQSGYITVIDSKTEIH